MLKLAICDDSRSDIELLESIFDQLHYSFHYDVFFSAEELLQFQKEHGEAYHLYMFDIEMPMACTTNWNLKSRKFICWVMQRKLAILCMEYGMPLKWQIIYKKK